MDRRVGVAVITVFSVFILVALPACGRIGFDALSRNPSQYDAQAELTKPEQLAKAEPCQGCKGFTPSNLDPQVNLPTPTHALTVPSGARIVIDSDQGAIHNSSGAIIRAAGPGLLSGMHFAVANGVGVLTVSAFEVQSTASVEVRGSMPLVIIALGDATINGTIDASGGLCADGSSNLRCGGPGGGQGGLAAAGSGCGAGGLGSDEGNAGGGGGGFGGDGAKGGGEINGGGPALGGGTAGLAKNCTAVSLSPLHGGSGGGSGGEGGGAGGGGGGAIQITSFTQITLGSGASIRAGGAGGTASASGGGGGGSGGAILLESLTINASEGSLAANGGGGGEGGGSKRGETGNLGVTPAAGGSSTGHRGGAGASKESPADDGLDADKNAGGGGGGVGIIRLHTLENAVDIGIVSPAPTWGILQID